MVTSESSGQSYNSHSPSYLSDDSKRRNQVSTYVTDTELAFLEKRKKELGCSRSDVLEKLIAEAVAEYRRRNYGR